MSASDYGLNYGLKPGDKLPSVAALRRQQRAQEQASAIANKTLNTLLSHPNQAATRSLLSVSSALHPDNPGYANSLQQLSDVAAATPGTMPDAAAAMVYNGIDPDTKLGAQLSSVQASADLQAGAEKLKTEWIARQAAELQTQADAAAENSGPMGYVKSFAQVTMNAMSFAQQVEMNVLREVINTKDGNPDPIMSYFTAGLNSDIYTNTDLGQNIAGGLHYVDTGKLNMDQLDMGDGFLPEPESPVLKLKVARDQQMMGTAGRNTRVIDIEQPDGTIKKQVVDDSPASPGQWVASDVFDLEVGTRPYQMMSGLLDAGSYLLDPTMYLTGGGVTKGFALAENKLLRAAHPTMDSKLSAMEQGAWKGAADEGLTGVATTEAQKATAAAKLAENEQLLAFEREAHDAAQRAVGEATSPQVRAEADAAAKSGAVRTLTPATKEAAQAGADESFARQAHLILGEQEPKLTKAAAEAEDAARLEQKRLYTPVEDAAPAVADDVAEGAAKAEPPAPTVTAVEAGGKYHLTHSSGAVIAVVDDAAEAERLAGELSKMPGYAKGRTLEQVESWDYVKQRGETLGPVADDVAAEFKAANEAADAAKEPDTVPGGSAGDGHSVDDLLAKRDGHKQMLEQLQQIRQELETEAANAERNHARAEVHAKAQAARIHEQMRHSKFSGDPIDNNDAMQFLREVSGLKAGSNALDVDKALGFITNNYNGAWNKLMDSMVAIKDPALLDEVTRGKLGAEAVADIAAAGSKDELRAVLAKHLARPDALSANMGRLRGVKIAARVRYGKDLDAVVSEYARFFWHPALGAVLYGKQLKRAAVPWAHARHIEDHDGVVDAAFDQITYALNMNRAVSHHGGQGIHGKGGVGKRATPGDEALLDDAGQPVLDAAGAPKMKDIWEDVPYESALDFRRKWMAEFIKAKPGQELRGLWNKLHTELVDRAADIHGLPSELRTQFKEALRLSRMDVKHYTAYNTETRAAEIHRQVLFDGEVISDDLVSKEAQMSDYLIAPDWQEMRRAMSSAKEVLDKGGLYGNSRKMLNEITGTVFERYWRTSVIAFRGAYLIRNMADIQFRMLLNGSPNMATNPQAILGLAFSHLAEPQGRIGQAFNPLNKAIGKVLDKAKVGDSTLLGKDFYEQAEPELQAYLQKYLGEEHVFGGTPFQDLASKGNRSWADPTQGAAPKYETIGYEDEIQAPRPGTRAADAEKFWEGWDFNLGLLRNSPMAAMTLDVMHGEVPAFLKSRAGQGLLSPKEALVDWLITDKSGRKILDRARDGSPGIRRMVGDPDVDNGRRLGLYLFGEDEGSLASQWDRLTLNGDEALVNAARAPRMEDEAGRLQQRRDMQKLIKARAKEQKYIVDGVMSDKRLPVGAVQRDITVENKQGFWAHYDKLVDFFFSSSGKFEHAAGYLPEFRFNKWSRAASMAAVLSPGDAAKLVANATKALGGHHMPNSWAGRTLRELKRNAGKAKGSGAFSLDDLEHATDVMAAKHVKELFYDARNRNQFANSLRLISPFAQPWANTLMQWTKLGLAKPGKVYAAGVLFSAAEGRNSNWLQDDPMSPNDAFFYRDPKSRQLTVGVPMLGPAMALIGNLNPVTKMHNLGSDAPISIDPSMVGGGIQLQSMNIALQDGLLPGSGPLGTLTAGVLEQFGWYRSSMPDVFKDFLMPFVNADPDSDPTVASTLIPAWAQGILGSLGFRDWAPKIEKYMPGAMAALAQQNPDNRYYSLNAQGDIQQSDAQRAAFITDSEHYAGSMLFGRAWVQNVAPGAPQVQQLMVADDGRIMATAKLSQEYMSELRTTGDRTKALTTMVERYGAEALFAMLPTRGSTVTPTNAAYQFLKENPGMAEDYMPIIGIMAPEGGYSARMDRYMRQRGGDPSLSTDETSKYINAFAKDAAQGQIDKRYNAGEITKEQYDAESQGLTDSYQEAGADMPNWSNFGEDAASYRAALVGSPDGTFKGALADPEFVKAFPKVAPALIQYEKYRAYAIQHSGKDTFGSNEMSEWNAWLWKKQGELIQQYPSSRVAFTKVYMPELEAK